MRSGLTHGDSKSPDCAERQPGLTDGDAHSGTRNAADAVMCLTCGCMDAHKQMGESNIRYEDVKAAADENGRSVDETLDIVKRTVEIDRGEHSSEYG
jgi:hypothetical protein